MSSRSSLLAVRAIGAEFARQLWWSSFIITLGISVFALIVLFWLVSMSGWWWLLALPIGVGISVGAVILIVFRLLIRYVRPRQTTSQHSQVRTFVTKLRLIAEVTSTPNFILLFRVIRSIAAPKSEPYLKNLFETTRLRKDFLTITHSFDHKK